jgi:hypothetical protein
MPTPSFAAGVEAIHPERTGYADFAACFAVVGKAPFGAAGRVTPREIVG